MSEQKGTTKFRIADVAIICVCLALVEIVAANGKEDLPHQEGNGIPLYGIMVTRSDYWVISTWLEHHAALFVKLAILDGTADVSGRGMVEAACRKYENVIYAHESRFADDARVMKKSDNSLRSVAMDLLTERDVRTKWVVVAHPDEFYLQSLADLAVAADRSGATYIKFKQLLAMPHSSRKTELADAIQRGPEGFDIVRQITKCVVTGNRVEEDRMFKYLAGVKFGWRHGLTIPERFPGKKEFATKGLYVHYKIHNFDSGAIARHGGFTNSAWSRLYKTSVPVNTSDITSLFGFYDKRTDVWRRVALTCARMAEDACSHVHSSVSCKHLRTLFPNKHVRHTDSKNSSDYPTID